jgi:hypothetical protein
MLLLVLRDQSFAIRIKAESSIDQTLIIERRNHGQVFVSDALNRQGPDLSKQIIIEKVSSPIIYGLKNP